MLPPRALLEYRLGVQKPHIYSRVNPTELRISNGTLPTPLLGCAFVTRRLRTLQVRGAPRSSARSKIGAVNVLLLIRISVTGKTRALGPRIDLGGQDGRTAFSRR